MGSGEEENGEHATGGPGEGEFSGKQKLTFIVTTDNGTSMCLIGSCCHCSLQGFPLHTRGTPEPDKKEKDKNLDDVFSKPGLYQTMSTEPGGQTLQTAWRRKEWKGERPRNLSRSQWGFSGSKHMLQTFVDLQVQQSQARLPLQSIENSTAACPYIPTPATFHMLSEAVALPLFPPGH
ncbi:hypothetical protein UY3_07647 [Chelonia mydas]|uniref:Uncharacterized protein n=1 Tax=Chelonia mydas TaxID=8469 RepID=M7BDH5_CHEMY|nr:hypothetical protein UY3_07647 [Chelonia mydas]